MPEVLATLALVVLIVTILLVGSGIVMGFVAVFSTPVAPSAVPAGAAAAKRETTFADILKDLARNISASVKVLLKPESTRSTRAAALAVVFAVSGVLSVLLSIGLVAAAAVSPGEPEQPGVTDTPSPAPTVG